MLIWDQLTPASHRRIPQVGTLGHGAALLSTSLCADISNMVAGIVVDVTEGAKGEIEYSLASSCANAVEASINSAAHKIQGARQFFALMETPFLIRRRDEVAEWGRLRCALSY